MTGSGAGFSADEIHANVLCVILGELVVLGDKKWQKEVWGNRDKRYLSSFLDSLTNLEFDVDDGFLEQDLNAIGVSDQLRINLAKTIDKAIAFFHGALSDPVMADAIAHNVDVLLCNPDWLAVVDSARCTLLEFKHLAFYPPKRTKDYNL